MSGRRRIVIGATVAALALGAAPGFATAPTSQAVTTATATGPQPIRTLLAAAWGLGILYATIQTRRHVALDLSAGVAVGVLCGAAVRLWLARRASTLSIEPVST